MMSAQVKHKKLYLELPTLFSQGNNYIYELSVLNNENWLNKENRGNNFKTYHITVLGR